MSAGSVICYNCFKERQLGGGPCLYCGFDLEENIEKYPVALRAGTVLNNRYIVGRVLGQGGFGITYLAFDTKLQARVAVKEYMPGELATRVEGTTVSVMAATRSEDFVYGAERFQEEARTLAKFMGQPGIAGVSDYFDENNTSYFVMDYIEGISFKTYIANQGGKVSVEEALNIMIPVLRALTAVHAEGFIHRDVTPDNIYISKDGNVKLLDFGSARYSIGDKSKSLDVILKVGYAPKEQYIRRGRQGAYTDVYSCAACFYAALTGYLPPESLERLDQDTLVPPSQVGVELPLYLERAILKGLAVQPEDRFQSAAEFLEVLESQQVLELSGVTAGQEASSQGGEKAALLKPETASKRKLPLLIGGAVLSVALIAGAGILIGRRGAEVAAPADNSVSYTGASVGTEVVQPEEIQPLLQAEVPSITIAGETYSTDLQKLKLENMGLTDADLSQLHHMVNLTSLDLRGNSFTDLSQVAGLTQLEELMVDGAGISDLTPLSGLTKLKELHLVSDMDMEVAYRDLTPLAGLNSLRMLHLSSCGPESLAGLEGMTQLENLTVRNSRGVSVLKDISAVAGMTNLKTLYLITAGVSSLESLTNLTALESLTLGGELYIDDLSPLAGLTQLRDLELRNNYSARALDIAPLSGMTQMQDLLLPSTVADLSPLAGMSKLRILTLNDRNWTGDDSTLFSSLEPLAGLTSLTSLTLRSDSVTDLTPLSGLVNLHNLSLYTVRVTDLTPLSELSNLKSAMIDGRNVRDWSPLDHVPGVMKN